MIKLNVEEFTKLQLAAKLRDDKSVAEFVGVSNSTIWRIKHDKMLPGNEFISKILEAFPTKSFEELFFIG